MAAWPHGRIRRRPAEGRRLGRLHLHPGLSRAQRIEAATATPPSTTLRTASSTSAPCRTSATRSSPSIWRTLAVLTRRRWKSSRPKSLLANTCKGCTAHPLRTIWGCAYFETPSFFIKVRLMTECGWLNCRIVFVVFRKICKFSDLQI